MNTINSRTRPVGVECDGLGCHVWTQGATLRPVPPLQGGNIGWYYAKGATPTQGDALTQGVTQGCHLNPRWGLASHDQPSPEGALCDSPGLRPGRQHPGILSPGPRCPERASGDIPCRNPISRFAHSGRIFSGLTYTQGATLGYRMNPRWGLAHHDQPSPEGASCDSPGQRPGILSPSPRCPERASGDSPGYNPGSGTPSNYNP